MPNMDLAAFNSILKEGYLPPLREQINKSALILDRLVKNTKDIEGKYAVIPIRTRLPQGAGARAENVVLPGPRKSEFTELKPKLKYYYGAIEMTGPSMRQTGKAAGSMIRAMDTEVKGLKETLALNLAHDFYGGHTLAVCGITAGANLIVLNADTNMEHFSVDMVVDIVDAATGAVVAANSRAITAVDKAGKTITVDGAVVTTAVTDIVVREDTYGACVNGLSDIIKATGSLHGVDPSSYPVWKSSAQSSPTTLALKDIQAFVDTIVVNSGKMPTMILGDYKLQRLYANLLMTTKTYMATQPAPKMDGGFRSLEYTAGGAPIEWVADRLMFAKTLYFMHEPDLQVFTPGDWEFIEIGGDVWLPQIIGANGVDSYKATIRRDLELGCYVRNSHGVWDAIAA